MSAQIVKWQPQSKTDTVVAFLRRPTFDERAEETARKVLLDIKVNGNRAIAKYVKRFDGAVLRTADFLVDRADLTKAREQVDADFRSAARESHKRIVAFARAGIKRDWSMSSPRGGTLGEQFRPLDRVGVYVPGGSAPLVSTALMTVALGKVAGVPEIVVCTPCGEDLKINPFLLYALEAAGAGEIYRVGGIQAIGLLAYGTRTIGKVQKIVGPGGTHVTAAKRQVYGQVALDLVAGPSEIAVLADDSADPRYVAVDLLSQAEHGTGWEKALLVTSSMNLATAVRRELEVRVPSLSRQKAVRRIMKKGMLLVVVNTLDEGMDLCNRFAPEHLEIMVREPKNWLKKVSSAGAVFVGAWSPESVGVYVAGPSHVLPTGGTASMFSGLSVDDFRRRSSFISFTRADLYDVLHVIEAFGRVEGLDGHALSARVRFEKK